MFSQRTNWHLHRNALTQALDEMRELKQSIFDLTISNPTEAGILPNYDRVLAALGGPKALTYDPQPRGLLAARQAVSHYYGESHHIDLDPDRLLLTTSTSEAYAHVFRLLCNVGDEVLVPKPSYPLFEFLADLADVKLIPYPLVYDHGWQIDLESLRRSVTSRTRAVILVHPNNPTGSYVSGAETSALNVFCREHEMALIVDEVFLDYAHDGTARTSFAGNNDALTFTLSGVSKISAMPQMKFAWVATGGPKALVDDAIARLEIISDTFLSMNTPVQLAAREILEQRKSIQPVVGDRLRSNLTELDRQLLLSPSCSRLLVEGGWYAVLRIPAIENDEELAIRLLREGGVSVHPGHFYDFPREGFLVLSLLTEPSIFRAGVSRLLPLVRQ